MNWWRKKPPPPIAFPLPPIEQKIEPKPEPMEVTELHEQMTRTGIFRVWDKWQGK